jgi:transketolase C-terminal domain/subunit
VYVSRDRTRLKLALRGKRLGLQLSEICQLIDMYEGPRDTVPQLAHYMAVLTAQRQTLEQQRQDLEETLSEIVQQQEVCELLLKEKTKVSILSSGYLLQRAYDASIILQKEFKIDVQIIDVIRIKPLNIEFIINNMRDSNIVVTIEEQALSAAFGAAIVEGLSDRIFQAKVLRLGLKTAYVFENGTRDQLLDNNGLAVLNIVHKVNEFVRAQERQ